MKKCMKLVVLTLFIIIVSGLTFVSCDKEEPNYGTFYTLQEAYDLGYIDMQDLKSIAYHQNKEVGVEDDNDYGPAFVPSPLILPTLSYEEKEKMLTAYNKQLAKEHPNVEDVVSSYCMGIWRYYGEYNGYKAVLIYGVVFTALDSRVIEGITFHFSGHPETIYIWVK